MTAKTPQDHRPSTARKQTRTTKAKRTEVLDRGITIRVDGEEYTVRDGDLTSLDTMELRRATGMSFVQVTMAMQEAADIDLIAALVWLSRRIDGERGLPFSVVAQEIGYDVDIEVVGDAEPETDPQT